MSFDFDYYFKRLDPLNSWTISRLTGGLVNLTVRATKNKNGNDENEAAGQFGQFKGYQSLILKYAPPFVASVGETAPFDQIRQVRPDHYIAPVSYPGPDDVYNHANQGCRRLKRMPLHYFPSRMARLYLFRQKHP